MKVFFFLRERKDLIFAKEKLKRIMVKECKGINNRRFHKNYQPGEVVKWERLRIKRNGRLKNNGKTE